MCGAGLRVVACDDDDGVDLLVSEVERVVVEVDADAVVGGGGSGEGDVWENAHVEDGLSFCAFCADLRDDDGGFCRVWCVGWFCGWGSRCRRTIV